MPETPVLSVRLSEWIKKDVDSRADHFSRRSDVVRTDLSRYRSLIRATQARMKEEGIFSDDEQGLILDALNGTMLGEHPQTLTANVVDAMALDGVDEKWGVNRAVMKEKLSSLTPLELAATADLVEAFWAASGRGEDRDARGGLFG